MRVAPALDVAAEQFRERVVVGVKGGSRFVGLFATLEPQGVRLLALLSLHGKLAYEATVLPPGATRYPSLTPLVPAASWYEREICDLFGILPEGHPRPGPLLWPGKPDGAAPLVASTDGQRELALTPVPPHLEGEGVFTLPYGPVRSGVFEAVGYLVETPGEDIPYLRPLVYYKHRGTERSFEGRSTDDGVLMAERYEGVASVAHAMAYCQAVEHLAQIELPERAGLVRVVHAELERVANHLDSTARHTEAAGQAVAFARLSVHKERVQRLRAGLCGSRFGRGVVVPGGVSAMLQLPGSEVLTTVDALQHAITKDLRLLLATPSFVDRLRGTGVLSTAVATERAALGPVGRGSGQAEDTRFSRPYAAYGQLGYTPVASRTAGDALARQRVRDDEIAGSFHLVRQAVTQLASLGEPRHQDDVRVPVGPAEGEAVATVEAPQGELVYLVRSSLHGLDRVKVRSASFHNLAFFHLAFPKDILTDFAFIEASFGLSMAGVSG